MDYLFYLIMVKKASADENEDLPPGASVGGSIPKFYLRPVTVMALDTFAATHGPFTDVDGIYTKNYLSPLFWLLLTNCFIGVVLVIDRAEVVLGKRKAATNSLSVWSKTGEHGGSKKQKHPAYFVPELAHIVAMCDERLPFALLTVEVSRNWLRSQDFC